MRHTSHIFTAIFLRRIHAAKLLLVIGVILLALPTDLSAQRNRPDHGTRNASTAKTVENNGYVEIDDYRSKNFALRTDLPADEARALLDRLEVLLRSISKYWGRPPSGVMSLYVAKEINRWPQETLAEMSSQGIDSIRRNTGLCLNITQTRGDQFRAKSMVYSCASPDIVQHEIVHAYCNQAFGRTGPKWYSEGMAEMGEYWGEDHDDGVQADPGVINYLRHNRPKSVIEIVNDDVSNSWQYYARRWSLCHFLSHHPAYSPTFHKLGNAYLNEKNVTFETAFGPVAKQLTFEYLFFIKHMDPGYRVDLCAWDWDRRFIPMPTSGLAVTVSVNADAGWQPSGILVEKDVTYYFQSTGSWTADPTSGETSADGTEHGQVGQLVATVIDTDGNLSEEIPLGTKGSFTPIADGRVYLRCRDRWGKLSDNSGTISVRLSSESLE